MDSNLRRYSMPSAGIYDLLTGLLFRGRYDEIAADAEAAAPEEGGVLDAGCGPGEVLIRLARRAPGLRLTGVDVDAPMIERARRKAARAFPAGRNRTPIRVPTFVVADIAALPFDDASFDLIVTSFAVHHWPDAHAGLAELFRVLKPAGRAVVWDVVAPMDLIAAHASPGAHVVAPGGPSWLTALRMLRRFGRMTPQRFEFVKDIDGRVRQLPAASKPEPASTNAR